MIRTGPAIGGPANGITLTSLYGAGKILVPVGKGGFGSVSYLWTGRAWLLEGAMG